MSEAIVFSPSLKAQRVIDIFDEDIKTCEVLSLLLRLEGFDTAFDIDVAGLKWRLEHKRPDLVICNSSLPAPDWESLQALLRQMHIPVILLQDHPDVLAAVEAMKRGVASVVPKPFDSEFLLDVIREEIARDLRIYTGDGRAEISTRGFSQLTARETDVLRTVLEGKTNKEAGKELEISPRTVEVHRSNVMKKLGARNTADLVRITMAR